MGNNEQESTEKTVLDGHFIRKDQSKSYTEVMTRLDVAPVQVEPQTQETEEEAEND